MIGDPGDPLHGQTIARDGGAHAHRDAEHAAHDHLLDQGLAEVDRLVLFIVLLNQQVEAGELFGGELDLRLREESSCSLAAKCSGSLDLALAAALAIGVAPAVHRVLVLAVVAAISNC